MNFNLIISHDEICNPSYTSGSRKQCPRAIVDVLGQLLISKMTFSAFVGPVLALILNAVTPVRAAKTWLFRKCNPEYQPSTSLDSEIAGVVMLMEIPLVLGFCVPYLIPLAAISFAAHAAVFHTCVSKFDMALTDAASPSTRYMWVSLVLGYVFLAWFFFECDLCSRWLVILGMPLAIMITLLLWRYRGHTRNST